MKAVEKLQGKSEKSVIFLLSPAGENHGIDFWMTACQQGQPESVNRGGVKTVTPGNNDQGSVVVALMRSPADRKDGIVAFDRICVASGLSFSSQDQFAGSLGGVKLYSRPRLKSEGSSCKECLHFWQLIYTSHVTSDAKNIIFNNP